MKILIYRFLETQLYPNCHYKLDKGVTLASFPTSARTKQHDFSKNCSNRLSWVIEAEVGQKINVSLVVLSNQLNIRRKKALQAKKKRSGKSAMSREDLLRITREETDCFGLLVEFEMSTTSLICGNNEVSYLATSQSHRLEVLVEDQQVQFALLFEGV